MDASPDDRLEDEHDDSAGNEKENDKTNPLDDIVSIAVYPGIGIARVGNSPQYYLGPEAPGIVPDPGGCDGPGVDGGTYKDGEGRIKPQAARFRVYGFDADGEVLAELTTTNAAVEWNVHVRNMKAANYAFRGRYFFDPTLLRNGNIQATDGDGNPSRPVDRDRLIIDPGPKTISGPTQPAVHLDGGSIYDGVDPDGNGLPLPRNLPFTSEPPPDPDDPEHSVLVRYHSAEVNLGRLETDESGRLVFVPAIGKSESCTEPQVCIHKGYKNTEDPIDPVTGQYSYFNVPGWYDDTCGGSIEATVTFETCDGPRTLSTEGDPLKRAWVGVAPPKYSPWTYNAVSLLDLQIDMFPDEDPAGDQTDPANTEPVSFYRDIFPTLSTITHYGWTSGQAFGAHGPHNEPGDFLSPSLLRKLADPDCAEGDPYRAQIWAVMRHYRQDDHLGPPPMAAPYPPPRADPPGPESYRMPKLWGSGGEPSQNQFLREHLNPEIDPPNQFLTLTDQQLARFEKWASGDFVTGHPVRPKPLHDLDLRDQPRALNHAALQPTVGGGFHPGIEITYISTFPGWFAGPFRVTDVVRHCGEHLLTVEPGQVNGFMAMPWQGDFWSCNTAWWPAQRPEIVVRPDRRGRLGYENWFRGKGIPEDASTDPAYQEGYNIMVHIWPKLGIVAPESPDPRPGGEVAFREYERDTSLDESLDLPPGSPCVPAGYDGEPGEK